jgi:hypothetical protein
MFRSLVASVCTIFCIGAVLAPVEASARSGGLAFGRGAAVVGKGAAGRLIHPARRFHQMPGARLPRYGSGAIYGSSYDPVDYIGVAWPYPRVQAAAGGDVVRRCSSETVVVPSEAGGVRPITVTHATA